MIFAVEIFKASGLFSYVGKILGPVVRPLGIPPEVVPIAVLRPFSGGGSLGLLAGVVAEYGVDSYIGRVACVYMGSAETLFYVISLYMGSVGVKKTRFCRACGAALGLLWPDDFLPGLPVFLAGKRRVGFPLKNQGG